jgi:hypothetical protein
MPVKSSWRQIRISAERRDAYRLESEASVFWIIDGRFLIAACDTAAEGTLVDRGTGAIVAKVTLSAGACARVPLSRASATGQKAKVRLRRKNSTRKSR